MSEEYAEGMKPQGKVKIQWSPEFAYAIGLLASDGCLSSSQRHITLVSKDREMLENFKKCLNIDNKIANHPSGRGSALKVQFGDILFYEFLCEIGVTPRKSKTIGKLTIPSEFFFDFLRGSFDGDGTFYSYFDPRWKSSFMFYTVFASASRNHIDWLRGELFASLGISGHVTGGANISTMQLRYAKASSLILLPKLYYNRGVVCLSRKRRKIESALAIEGKLLTEQCAGGEMADASP